MIKNVISLVFCGVVACGGSLGSDSLDADGPEVFTTQQTSKLPPLRGPVTPSDPGNPGVPGPIIQYCEARYRACSNYCHAIYGGWCSLCEEGCETNCQHEYGLCIFG